jgi:glycosyltransferase involved in cell wall biosynthesis
LGGAEIALYNILNKLSEYDDVELHLFLPYAAKTLFDRRNIKVNYHVHSLPPKFIYLSLKNRRLASYYFQSYHNALFRKIKTDIAWFNMFFPLATGIKDYFLKKNIPFVIAGRGVDIQKEPSVGYGYRLDPKYERQIVQIISQATMAISISKSIKDEFASLGMPTDKIAVIPNVIDIERFRTVEPANLQKEHGINPKLKVLITVGRYTPKKGFEYIPAIIKELVKVRTDFIWLIIGKGIQEKLSIDSDISRYIKFITNYTTPDDNSFYLPGNKLVAVYKASDVFVFPTVIEGLGNVTLEAMAAGLPVIISDVPGCYDIITNNHDGILVDAGNTKKFAYEINNLLQNEDKSGKLVNAAYKTVGQYSADNVINKYYELFKETPLQKSSHR